MFGFLRCFFGGSDLGLYLLGWPLKPSEKRCLNMSLRNPIREKAQRAYPAWDAQDLGVSEIRVPYWRPYEKGILLFGTPILLRLQ